MNRTRIDYGEDPLQYGELYLPQGEGPFPVVVFVHGGFWENRYRLDLMDDLAAAARRRGLAVWNIEYRSIGDSGGAFPGTLADVAAAIDHLSAMHRVYDLDLERLATVGHSAGGHLVLWQAAQTDAVVRPAVAIGQAPVTDLVFTASASHGAASVIGLAGGTPDEQPARYASISPLALVPLGVDQVIVHGENDLIVPLAESERYVDAANSAGDTIDLVVVAGGHFEIIDPNATGGAVLDILGDRLGV